MNKEIQSIINNLESISSGHPWYGRAVYEILEEVDPAIASKKPGRTDHSMIELLYHMLTWAEFTLKRLEGDKEQDMAVFEKLDWRKIDPAIHNWKKGMTAFKTVNKKIIAILKKKEDAFLKEQVDYRKYNFRFLLNGMIQHHIYHLGQIAYLNKMLS